MYLSTPDYDHNKAPRKQIPDWQAELLRHTVIHEEHLHLLTTSCIVVSDGGIAEGKGNFGVILASANVVIAEVQGVARGNPLTID
jgi:hypothetical protein